MYFHSSDVKGIPVENVSTYYLPALLNPHILY